MKKLNASGYNLVELAIAVLILAAMASTVMMARSYMAKTTQKNSDKAFATQKAVQMVEELRGLVNGSESGVTILDNFSDGSKYNDILTTDKSVTNPVDPLSGNTARGPGWKFWRQVEVGTVANDPFARIVTVIVYQGDTLPFNITPTPGVTTANAGVVLAQTGAIMRTITTVTPPSQVLDVYGLAISNTVGWFTEMPQMAPAFAAAVNDLQNRNPGLIIRTHFINQSGYGRDPLYKAFINGSSLTTHNASAVSGGAAAYTIPYVYFYPGAVSQTSAAPLTAADFFFSETQLNQDGNIQDDTGAVSLASYYPSGWGYSVCDMYNHDMRYPDELAEYKAVSVYNASINHSVPEMTLRMLLEGMNSQPQSFQNAIIVSMHGEVLPLIGMRNYSDAAKDPANVVGLANGWSTSSINMRAVTHPTLLHFPTGAGVTMRVYGYYDGIDWTSAVNTLDGAYPTSGGSNDIRMPLMTVFIKGVTLNSATNLSVSCIYGGINQGVTTAYGVTLLPPSTVDPGSPSMGMSWKYGTTASNGGGTTIAFYNTPLRAPEVPTSPVSALFDRGGLPVTCQLYESEYISCPVSTMATTASDPYAPNLAATVKGPKNTARWVICIKNTAGPLLPDGQYTVETRLGNDLNSGTNVDSQTQAPNLSRTYVWLGGGSVSGLGTSSCGITPWTERYQYIGDPRDCPYADSKFGSAAMGTTDSFVTIAANSFNLYFKDLSANPQDGYYGYTTTTSGYEGNSDIRDMPKYYMLYRNGLLTQQGIFCNLNGYTAWHADMGGEFGDYYDPFCGSLNLGDKPWKPTDNTVKLINEIQPNSQCNGNDFQAVVSGGVTMTNQSARDIVRAASGSNSFTLTNQWYARYWRGELYPDDWFTGGSGWLANGNLPTGNGNFYRCFYQAIGNTNSIDGFASSTYQWGVGGNAAAAFINGVANGSTTQGFMHTTTNSGGSGQAQLSALGYNLYNIVSFPLNSPVSYARPWSWDYKLSSTPADWNTTTSLANRVKLSLPKIASPYGSGTSVTRIIYDPIDQSGEPNSSLASADTILHGVGAVEMDYPSTGSATQTAFYIASGLAPQGDFGANQLAETDLSFMVRTFMDAGLYSGSAHIPQLPLFQINSGNPTNQFPSTTSAITLTWTSPVTAQSSSTWWRWAGANNQANFYTEEYPGYNTQASNTYTEAGVTLLYVPMYSADGGKTWGYINSGSASGAVTGTYPGTGTTAATYVQAPTSIVWSVPSSTFPQGDYIARVEGYRQNYPLHFSFHQLIVNIDR